MFESIINFFKNLGKSDKKSNNSKDTAKERLHLVLMQDRANVSADFLDLMRQEIIEVIKKYVDVDESEIDVRMTNKQNEDGSNGAPALYANIPITNIKNDILLEKKKESDKKQEGILEEIANQSYENNNINNENNNQDIENVVKNEQNNEKYHEENYGQNSIENNTEHNEENNNQQAEQNNTEFTGENNEPITTGAFEQN